MIALAMRQAVRVKPMALVRERKVPSGTIPLSGTLCINEKGPLFIASPAPGKLDEIASEHSTPRRKIWRDSVSLWLANCPPMRPE